MCVAPGLPVLQLLPRDGMYRKNAALMFMYVIQYSLHYNISYIIQDISYVYDRAAGTASSTTPARPSPPVRATTLVIKIYSNVFHIYIYLGINWQNAIFFPGTRDQGLIIFFPRDQELRLLPERAVRRGRGKLTSCCCSVVVVDVSPCRRAPSTPTTRTAASGSAGPAAGGPPTGTPPTRAGDSGGQVES